MQCNAFLLKPPPTLPSPICWHRISHLFFILSFTIQFSSWDNQHAPKHLIIPWAYLTWLRMMQNTDGLAFDGYNLQTLIEMIMKFCKYYTFESPNETVTVKWQIQQAFPVPYWATSTITRTNVVKQYCKFIWKMSVLMHNINHLGRVYNNVECVKLYLQLVQKTRGCFASHPNSDGQVKCHLKDDSNQ